MPASAQGDDAHWQFIDRVTFDLDANTTYFLTAWTSASDPDAIALDPAPGFQFVLTRGDSRSVADAPPLRIEAWPCPDATCPTERPSDTGFLALVADGDDGTVDSRYTWSPDPERTFTTTGTWRLLVTPDNAPLGTGARLHLDLVDRDPTGNRLLDEFTDLRQAFDTPFGRVLAFVLWLFAFVVAARIAAWGLRRTVLSPQRIDPTVGRLALRLGSVTFLLIGLGFSLWVVFGVNFWAGLTALGLLSVALGFGMQNTVANLMGGINLAVDRPFVIGDRVQVGDTWGDVQEIGLRSTRILTTKHEVVIIPNKLLDEREIWNYTIDHPEMRIDIDAGISYDSDRRLAEALMLRAAHVHEDVLSYPRPRVLLQSFGESSIDLQLRIWIPGAKDARPIASRIRKEIQNLFNEHGVTIPFPHRTLVEHKDLAPPHKATPDELQGLAVRDPDLPRMVYATATPNPMRPTADLIARVASELDLALVVVHVTPSNDPRHRKEAARALATFRDAGAHYGVAVETLERFGDVPEVIREVVKEENAALLAIGSPRHNLVPSSFHVADITKQIRESIEIPVLIVPRNLRINDRTLRHYGKLIEAREKERRSEAGIEAREDSGADREDPDTNDTLDLDDMDDTDDPDEMDHTDDRSTRGPGGSPGGRKRDTE